jgi:hypothetical protein
MTGMVALLVVGLLGLAAIIALFLRHTNRPCPICGAWQLTPFDQTSRDHQHDIETYFNRVERRSPPRSRLFVCPDCGCVHDDFSGEKISRDLDIRGRSRCASALCKGCGLVILFPAGPDEHVTCRHCGMHHQWKPHGPHGLRFFEPGDPRAMLPRPPRTLFDA